MKIVVIGATGTIGSALTQQIEAQHPQAELVRVGRGDKENHKVDYIADLNNLSALREVFEQIGKVDAVVNFAGTAAIGRVFGPKAMDKAAFSVGLESKLLGQVALAQLAVEYLNPNGSITLTSGETSSIALQGMTSAGMVNAAVDAFVRGAALELNEGRRINVISPGMVKQTLQQIPDVSDDGGIDVDVVARAYLDVMVDSRVNGEVIVVTTDDNIKALKTFEAFLQSLG